MAGKTLDDEALENAATALGEYIKEISESVKTMKDAATDCSDNLDNDEYSKQAIEDLQKCSRLIGQSARKAQALQRDLKRKAEEIRRLKNAGGH